MASVSSTNFTFIPSKDDSLTRPNGKYGLEYKITTSTGIYTGNVTYYEGNIVPQGVGKWMPKEGDSLFGKWENGVFKRPLTNHGTPLIAENDSI